MAAVGLLFVLLFLLTILGTIGLWYAIDRETDDNPRMNRADAERAARQDTGGDTARSGNGREDDGDGREDDGDEDWGSDTQWGVDES